MRKLLFTLAIIGSTAAGALSQSTQSVSKDSTKKDQQFYFAKTNYSDSLALAKAIPALAQQVGDVYTDPDKRIYVETNITYQLLSGNYKKVVEVIDSLQKSDKDFSFEIEVKSYARAKMKEMSEPGSFSQAFKKEFADAFAMLSFRKKVSVAFLDTSVLSYFVADYDTAKEKFKRTAKDTLDLADARSLLEKFSGYAMYSEIIPLMTPLIDNQYKTQFPAIKHAKWAGAVPVKGLVDLTDPNMKYKLLFELTGFAYKGQDSTAKKAINDGLGSVARELNLHQASGIPKKNIDPVIVVHGGAIDALLSNEKYKKRYGIDNPNVVLVKELQAYGARIIVCGQLMTYARLEMEDLLPGIQLAFSAQTVLSTYQLKNYVHYDMSLTE